MMYLRGEVFSLDRFLFEDVDIWRGPIPLHVVEQPRGSIVDGDLTKVVGAENLTLTQNCKRRGIAPSLS